MLLEAEQGGEHPSLSPPVVLRNPENLAFSDHLRCFDARDHIPCRCDSARALHGSPPALNMPVI